MQGVIVAAPVYAATGSRWKAMGIAVASVRTFQGIFLLLYAGPHLPHLAKTLSTLLAG